MKGAMGTRLDHVRANVADLRRAVEWYTTVLGFEVESVWPPDRPNYAHFKSEGGATFAVMEAEGRGARFNFTVDDPDALWAELKDRAAVVEPLLEELPQALARGGRALRLAPPDPNEAHPSIRHPAVAPGIAFGLRQRSEPHRSEP